LEPVVRFRLALLVGLVERHRLAHFVPQQAAQAGSAVMFTGEEGLLGPQQAAPSTFRAGLARLGLVLRLPRVPVAQQIMLRRSNFSLVVAAVFLPLQQTLLEYRPLVVVVVP
jgi:hypothetical protein